MHLPQDGIIKTSSRHSNPATGGFFNIRFSSPIQTAPSAVSRSGYTKERREKRADIPSGTALLSLAFFFEKLPCVFYSAQLGEHARKLFNLNLFSIQAIILRFFFELQVIGKPLSR